VDAAAVDVAPFHWRDGERLVAFGRGCVAEAVQLVGGPGYALLSTPRAMASAAHVVEGAAAVHQVGPGRVDELAGELRGRVVGDRLVALGGGRVIDVAKALAAAARAGVSTAAIPTTLSGGEMTAVHRHAAGVSSDTPRVRPAVVVNDPALSASQPPSALAASAANALGHAAEGQLTPLRNPAARLLALESARLLASAYATGTDLDSEPARDALALAALLAGYVIGSGGYGLHHVLSQTVARLTPVGHGAANAIMLPVSLGALRARFPRELAALDVALGGEAEAFARGLRDRTGCARLSDAGVAGENVPELVAQAAGRQELALTPPAAGPEELRALLAAAL
jgi:alcohol dehydrogenase class IV